MKINTSIEQPPPNFRPVKLSVLIESQDELDNLVRQFGQMSGPTYGLYHELREVQRAKRQCKAS